MKHLTRVWHPYNRWEEVGFNMWGSVRQNERKEYLQKAIEFTGDHELYGSWMMKVANDWKYSCEHNLTGTGNNKRAWIGHAACAYAFKCPENIVREAWWCLSEEQRNKADAVAEEAINYWQTKYNHG